MTRTQVVLSGSSNPLYVQYIHSTHLIISSPPPISLTHLPPSSPQHIPVIFPTRSYGDISLTNRLTQSHWVCPCMCELPPWYVEGGCQTDMPIEAGLERKVAILEMELNQAKGGKQGNERSLSAGAHKSDSARRHSHDGAHRNIHSAGAEKGSTTPKGPSRSKPPSTVQYNQPARHTSGAYRQPGGVPHQMAGGPTAHHSTRSGRHQPPQAAFASSSPPPRSSSPPQHKPPPNTFYNHHKQSSGSPKQYNKPPPPPQAVMGM
eukprot:GHVN01105704.1.p1 GENE.GHVN01105704.1~~GHVN01105704.1.p1  ORF type:complete len:262 (-),score=50.42 GHVN01105704.1:819-1604(-)